MTQIILFTGAPGSGKTTVAGELHRRLGTPWFEFGWIPEFRQKNPHSTLSYDEEEALSFENLTLVVGNYLAHGFEGAIVSDLSDARVREMYAHFPDAARRVVTLYCSEELTRWRVTTRDNGNEYRDWEAALAIRSEILSRPALPDEIRIDTGDMDVCEIVDKIIESL